MRTSDLDYRRNTENPVELMCNVMETASVREGLAVFPEECKPRR